MAFRYIATLVLSLTIWNVSANTTMSQEGSQTRASEPRAIELITARCSACHGVTLTMAFCRRMLDAGGPFALDAFLTNHQVPDADVRAAIVQFLATTLKDEPEQ